jgi:hypothetical protein
MVKIGVIFMSFSNHSCHFRGWFKNPVSSQTEKLMAGTKFSDYLGLNHYKKSKKFETFHSFKVGQLASKFWFITIVYHQQ